MDTKIAEQKLSKLISYINSLESLAIAFSGGVDSTFLLKVAHDTLGDRAVGLTIKSHSVSKRENMETVAFCKAEGIPHYQILINELDIEGFRENPPDRCYICKKQLFEKMGQKAKELGILNLAEGSNTDDDGDYRPGHKAIKELGVLSPLRYAELSKEEIRYLSKKLNLPTWNKPSFACLSSRFPYGEEITIEKLDMVEKSEEFLAGLGFKQFRVRIHGNLARVEVPTDDFDLVMNNREKIILELKKYGFTYVTMDLQGYRTGSMNETLKLKE